MVHPSSSMHSTLLLNIHVASSPGPVMIGLRCDSDATIAYEAEPARLSAAQGTMLRGRLEHTCRSAITISA